MSQSRVLVDTYNLRLAKGSGIKTYGLSLLAALEKMGWTAELLGDRPIPGGVPDAVAEVMFHDAADPRVPSLARMRSWLRAAVSVAGSRRARAVPTGAVLSRHSARTRGFDGRFAQLWNAPGIYDEANALYAATKCWTRVRLAKRPDLFHATTMLPVHVPGVPRVTTIHDLIPLRLPYTCLDDKRLFWRLCRDTLQRSDLILTVSECSKRDILQWFDVDPNKVVVTWQALAPRQELESTDVDTLLRAFKLKRGEFMLFAGNIEPKKNLQAVIEAMTGIARRVPLVVAGAKAWMWEEQMRRARPLLGRGFIHLDYVSRRELQALYQGALGFVFPSLYEGFGLPPLEAMAEGCPVIASRSGSLPEVLGDAALYADPDDPGELRRQIERLVDDAVLRADLRERGLQRVEHFSMSAYAERLAAAYARVLG